MAFLDDIAVIGLMLILNGIFAAYEMALASISRTKLTVFVSEKRRGAEAALFMKDRMEASLAVVQLGITLFAAIAAATGGVGVVDSLAPFLKERYGLSHYWANFLALSFLIVPLSGFMIIFSELVPKVFAIGNKEWVCLKLSPIMKILSQMVYPVVLFFEHTVKRIIGIGRRHWNPALGSEDQSTYSFHELKAAATLAKTARLIGTRAEKIVLSAAQLSLRGIRSIMLSVSDIFMIPIHCTLSEALARAHMDMHTRFPVCEKEGDPQTIQGYVNFKDIVVALKLNPEDPTVKGIVRPIKTVHDQAPVAEVLEQMIQEKIHIALVRSGDQKIVGMVTLEDIIEELVGEIEDEFDYLPSYVHSYGAEGSSWIMGGGVSMNVVSQTVGANLSLASKEGRIPTLAEWCAEQLGRPPQGGEVIKKQGLTMTVRKLRRKKLAEAIVSRS